MLEILGISFGQFMLLIIINIILLVSSKISEFFAAIAIAATIVNFMFLIILAFAGLEQLWNYLEQF